MRPPAAPFRIMVGVIAAAFGFAAGPASAQTYPTQSIRIVVATAAGGIADLAARTLAQKLSEGGKTAVVENRTGGAGAIAAEAVAKAPPDGHTLLIGMHSINAILPHLVGKLSYDGIRDFAPVTNIVASANILVVHPAVPAQSMRELVALAKEKPGKLIYASQGNGTSGHIVGEQFKQLAGIDLVHVPYRGAAPAIQDLGRRPRVADVRHRAAGPRATRRRQGAGAGGGLAAAARGGGRGPDHGGSRVSRARRRTLVRPAGAGRNAARRRRVAQRRDPQGVRGGRRARALPFSGHDAAARHARRNFPRSSPPRAGAGATSCARPASGWSGRPTPAPRRSACRARRPCRIPSAPPGIQALVRRNRLFDAVEFDDDDAFGEPAS